MLANHLDQIPELTDYGSFDIAFYDDQQLELQFEFGRLRNLNFGALFDEGGDEILWPIGLALGSGCIIPLDPSDFDKG